MLIGLPGSGKSCYANNLLLEDDKSVIISSDALRKEVYGDEKVQGDSDKIFAKMLDRSKHWLNLNHHVIYDATNMTSKHRRAVLQALSKFACEKIAVFMATPYITCLARNDARTRKVPEEVIRRMYMNFDVPCIQEGFDFVKIIYPPDLAFKQPAKVVREMCKLPHDNPHHAETIGMHMFKAFKSLNNTEYVEKTLYDRPDDDVILGLATLLHDAGKPFTKTFKNRKDESSDIAHYYNHNNVGAYEVFMLAIDERLKIDIALLIQYHMHYYTSWKQSDKALEKDKQFLGARLFTLLELLHKCDVAAH